MKKLFETWCGISLVKRIVAGLIIGAILGVAVPQFSGIAILGSVFVGALKAVAPLLVFFLVISSLCHSWQEPRRRHPYRYCSVYVQYLPGSCHCCNCMP